MLDSFASLCIIFIQSFSSLPFGKVKLYSEIQKQKLTVKELYRVNTRDVNKHCRGEKASLLLRFSENYIYIYISIHLVKGKKIGNL